MKLVKRENEMCKRQEQDTAPGVLATSLSIEIERVFSYLRVRGM